MDRNRYAYIYIHIYTHRPRGLPGGQNRVNYKDFSAFIEDLQEGFNPAIPVKLLHSMKIFDKGSILSTPVELLHSMKIFNKGSILSPALNFYIH